MDTYQIKSMTGYGRGETVKESWRFITEIKTVNHRYLDVVVRYPHSWMAVEDAVRTLIKEKLRRGRVEVYLSLEGEQVAQKKLQLDWDLLQDLLHTQQEITERTGVIGQLEMRDLLAQNNLWQVSEKSFQVEKYREAIVSSVEQACCNLLQMREKEGQHLTIDLRSRLQKLELTVRRLQQELPEINNQFQNRLQSRVSDLLQNQELPENRLLIEVALLADRTDISEEITRLHSHLQQFHQTLLMSEPIGRKLDFIIQEMNREVNTIGSKANHEMTGKWVVESKSELEKMREQVQNIE